MKSKMKLNSEHLLELAMLKYMQYGEYKPFSDTISVKKYSNSITSTLVQ